MYRPCRCPSCGLNLCCLCAVHDSQASVFLVYGIEKKTTLLTYKDGLRWAMGIDTSYYPQFKVFLISLELFPSNHTSRRKFYLIKIPNILQSDQNSLPKVLQSYLVKSCQRAPPKGLLFRRCERESQRPTQQPSNQSAPVKK